jgi:outer membrane receptor protein involved in Fe transport
LPNPLLAPERQQGWEAGIDVAFGSAAHVSVTTFDQVAENLIASVFVASTPVFSQQWQNVGRVTNRGVEVEGALRTGPLRFTVQYGYVRSRIEDLGAAAAGNFLQVGDEPRYTPTHTAGGSVTAAPWPSTTATLGVTYVGDWREFDLLAFYRCFGGTGDCRPDLRDYIVDFPGFAKVNLAIGQRLTRRLEGSIAIENLTNNEAYESGNTLPVMGRTIMVGLRFRY